MVIIRVAPRRCVAASPLSRTPDATDGVGASDRVLDSTPHTELTIGTGTAVAVESQVSASCAVGSPYFIRTCAGPCERAARLQAGAAVPANAKLTVTQRRQTQDECEWR